MKIVCWNVAGIRGSFKKGAMDWFSGGTYDIVCIQETKATQEEVIDIVKEGTSGNP